MSEYCPEEHPLLREEVPKEKFKPQEYYHRVSMTYRTRQNLKGAAAVLTHWPDHWSSLLSYWWIGLGMISITTFVIYNCLFSFSMLPSASLKTHHSILKDVIEKTTAKIPLVPDVFMHVFLDENKEINIKKYVTNIETVSRQFVNFKYHLIIVVNDTNVDSLSPNENNELALDLLWTKDRNAPKKYTIKNSNIQVHYTTLSTYMDQSPLVKYWRMLQPQLIEFLARAISIWDKGGVAFNPNILIERNKNSLYMEKLNNLLNKYSHVTNTSHNINTTHDSRKKSLNKTTKFNMVQKNRKFNNIRDIINALEDESSPLTLSHQNLIEVEDKISTTIRKNEHPSITLVPFFKNESQKHPDPNYEVASNLSAANGVYDKNSNQFEMYTESNNHSSSNNKTKHDLLPLFLDFLLFHNKDTNRSKPMPTDKTRNRRSVAIDERSVIKFPEYKLDKPLKEGLSPVIVKAPGNYNQIIINKTSTETNKTNSKEILDVNRLTIDLKGNIIATDTACHAFLGTIFSNVVHHRDEETVTDFIISELTFFCNGLLSSCMGIDLMLL